VHFYRTSLDKNVTKMTYQILVFLVKGDSGQVFICSSNDSVGGLKCTLGFRVPLKVFDKVFPRKIAGIKTDSRGLSRDPLQKRSIVVEPVIGSVIEKKHFFQLIVAICLLKE